MGETTPNSGLSAFVRSARRALTTIAVKTPAMASSTMTDTIQTISDIRPVYTKQSVVTEHRERHER